jgi:hypothetical protein
MRGSLTSAGVRVLTSLQIFFRSWRIQQTETAKRAAPSRPGDVVPTPGENVVASLACQNVSRLRLDLAERCFGAADGTFALQREDARQRRAAFHDIGGAFGDIADRDRVDIATIGCS